ncbi:MAG TPA: right-handed parallel beta-helix repeat-containing protein [Pyrinomonadaceae bacterium]|jgi:hypothetical protein|nr:right-handed parallel beta-helix repeat-containing protein [Pyrinomonadaceae bacterium]
MNDLPRQKLREIVARHGPSIVEDPRRCEGLLRDHLGAHRREANVLAAALEERVPQDILAAPAGSPRAALLARLTRRLSDNLALAEEAARWAVGSWALALGSVTDEDLKGMEAGASEESDAPEPVVNAAAPAAVVVVAADGSGDYTSLAAALKAIAPHGRVVVRPGSYEESIVVDAPVEIVGEGPRDAVVIVGADASCLRMEAGRARVAGLTLRGEARGDAAFFAVEVAGGELVLEDCDITSTTLSCVGVHGESAAPVIRRCRVRDGADSGLYFFDGARGSVEDCEVFNNANVGLAVTGGADPSIIRCRIHDGVSAGVAVWQGGLGLLEGCEIYGNRMAGLGVSEGGRPTVRACLIREGGNTGVFIHHGGEATLEDCELFGHRDAEAAVTTGGKLFLKNCRVHHGRGSGVVSAEGGGVLLQGCAVSDNAAAGVRVGPGSTAALLECHVNGNAGAGLSVADGGVVKAEDSDLTGNRLGAWDAEEGARIESERNLD